MTRALWSACGSGCRRFPSLSHKGSALQNSAGWHCFDFTGNACTPGAVLGRTTIRRVFIYCIFIDACEGGAAKRPAWLLD
jgi:hypothetical protein